jgi:hypothetical protein
MSIRTLDNWLLPLAGGYGKTSMYPPFLLDLSPFFHGSTKARELPLPTAARFQRTTLFWKETARRADAIGGKGQRIPPPSKG